MTWAARASQVLAHGRGGRATGTGRAAARAAGTLALLALLWWLWPERTVYVANETRGQTIARLPVLDEAPLQLRYVHSVYRQPAAEEFRVRPDGLELVRLASPSVAVLEYYARAEPIAPAGEGYEIRIAGRQLYGRLSVLAGETGRRTVAYAGRELPLQCLAADGDRISLSVIRAPRLARLWPTAR